MGDFLATSVSNKFGALEDNNNARRRKQKNPQPPPILDSGIVHKVAPPKITTRETPSLDAMTLDELDKVIREEEAKFTTIMANEAEHERVVAVVRSRTPPSQGEAIYPPTPPSQGGASTTTTTTDVLKIVEAKVVERGDSGGADGVPEALAGEAATTDGRDPTIIPTSGAPKTCTKVETDSTVRARNDQAFICGECNVGTTTTPVPT